MDRFDKTQPWNQMIPALMFSSSLSCLGKVVPLLVAHFSQPNTPVSKPYSEYDECFRHLRVKRPYGFEDGVHPRSWEAIKRLPQSLFSWGPDLAIGLKYLLQQLSSYSWTPECLWPSRHHQWLRRTKPLKHISQGSPKLSHNFYSYLGRLPKPDRRYYGNASLLDRHQYDHDHADKIWYRRERSFIFLKAIICYLHKCDYNNELAKLGRRSLPKAALWFPRLMKKARAKMDAYVLRWEGVGSFLSILLLL